MKNLLLLSLVYLFAFSASGVIDPTPDTIGVYFEQNADVRCINSPASVPFFTYLILTNPTPTAINAYECGLEFRVPGGMEGMFFQLASNIANGVVSGIDVGVNDALGGDYIVGLAEPIPAQQATILHSWQHMLLAVIPVEIYLGASSAPSIPGDFPVIQDSDGSVLYQAGLLLPPGYPVAGVNDITLCPHPVEARSFGSLKSLFH
jgi:hypothetical protein